ncbi:hypothetical protein [Kaarinaea lacus]
MWLVYVLLVVSVLLILFSLRQLVWGVMHSKDLLPEEQRMWFIFTFLLIVGVFGMVATVAAVLFDQPYWIVDQIQSVIANIN